MPHRVCLSFPNRLSDPNESFVRTKQAFRPLSMHTTAPPTLETFSHWPSWLNSYRNLDRSACFELRVSQVRRLPGCIPLMKGQFGKRYRAKSRAGYDVPDLPNERPDRSRERQISRGWYDITPMELDWLARHQLPRRLAVLRCHPAHFPL